MKKQTETDKKVHPINRQVYGKVYIQSRRSNTGVPGCMYLAWSSEEPSDHPIGTPGEVHFEFGNTEEEAIMKLKAELDSVESRD